MQNVSVFHQDVKCVIKGLSQFKRYFIIDNKNAHFLKLNTVSSI